LKQKQPEDESKIKAFQNNHRITHLKPLKLYSSKCAITKIFEIPTATQFWVNNKTYFDNNNK
jgi:hypothetical protein